MHPPDCNLALIILWRPTRDATDAADAKHGSILAIIHMHRTTTAPDVYAQRAKSNWSRLASRKPTRRIAHGKRSALARMLSDDANSTISRAWSSLQTLSIVISFGVHVAATNVYAAKTYVRTLNLLEDATSGAFFLDYVARLWTCHERRSYSHLGRFEGTLRWAVTPAALVMAASCFPILTDVSSHDNTNVWLTLPRILLLFRASRWRAAVRTAKRVVFVNRDILYTSLALVSLTILLSAALLYATCAPDTDCAKENGITDVPSATFVAAMMLTGQASPEGTAMQRLEGPLE